MNYGGFAPPNMVQNNQTPNELIPAGWTSPRKLSKQLVQPEVEEKEEEICQVESSDPRYYPNELKSFEQGNFPEAFVQLFRQSNYLNPTPIQRYGIPVGMDGKDIVGIANIT